ncbi:MAG: glycosyltransferase family 2 protein [Fermentimonas sp.]|jgi:hypothetical protein
MSASPILLFVYNRPAHTLKTLEALRKNHLSESSKLYVFSDGAKCDKDKEKVGEVRKLIQSINGFKEVEIIERRENFGLAKNIINGVTDIINEHGKVIVVEDDLISSPWFLTFMNEALEKYEDEPKIGHIQGFFFPIDNLPDAFLIRWTGSWGWGTWKDSWKYFNPNGKELLKELEGRRLTKEFDFNGKYPFTRMLRRQVNGENDSWAIRWNASLFLNGILSLNAGKSLINNIGFDGSGVHSGSDEIYTTPLYDRKLEIDIDKIEENLVARKAIEKYHSKTYSLWSKGMRRLKGIIKNI